MFGLLALVPLLPLLASAQQTGTYTAESHPTLTAQSCTAKGTCTDLDTSIVLDSNWRWLHSTSGYTNCYTGNEWDTSICTDPVTCAKNCALEGVNYKSTYGITASGDSLTLNFVTKTSNTNVGSRVYLMADDDNYYMFKLKNKEFTFDVDVSNLPCGLNGALYLVQMDEDGGLSRFTNNKAGAKYGTGYCDTQCPHDIKFINGEANILDWTPSDSDSNAGTGYYGTCCVEMDIWEANKISSAYTPHSCTVTEQTRCSGTDCGDIDTDERYDGVCDKDGCDFNSYRNGNTTFYGPDEIVDTSSTFTVVTQFITDDGTDTGTLSAIKRFYVQNGKTIANSYGVWTGLKDYNSITPAYCKAEKSVFNDTDSFDSKGGFDSIDDAMESGMVLALSLWDDHEANMLWLDSNYPTTSDASTPGVARGTCSTSSGDPDAVESQYPDSSVTYSNIKFGPLNTTY